MNLLTIEARTNSTRLPGKVLMNLGGVPLIKIIHDKSKKLKFVDRCVVATTYSKSDDYLVNYLKDNNIPFFRGDIDNVWKRLMHCCIENKAINLIKLTGDNPFIDIEIIEEAFTSFLMIQPIDIMCVSNKRSLPIGLDFEILKVKSLVDEYLDSRTDYDKEHATTFLKNKCKRYDFFPKQSLPTDFISNTEFTIDTKSDLEFAHRILSLSNNSIDKIHVGNLLDLYLKYDLNHTSNRKWDKGI